MTQGHRGGCFGEYFCGDIKSSTSAKNTIGVEFVANAFFLL